MKSKRQKGGLKKGGGGCGGESRDTPLPSLPPCKGQELWVSCGVYHYADADSDSFYPDTTEQAM